MSDGCRKAARPSIARPGTNATRLPASALVEFARQQLGRPVFDATGLEDRYDWLLQWDPLGEKREILIAFGDLGFELAPVERPLPRRRLPFPATW